MGVGVRQVYSKEIYRLEVCLATHEKDSGKSQVLCFDHNPSLW